MERFIYNILKRYSLKINNLNDFDLFNKFHNLYIELISYLNSINYQNIGIIKRKCDDINCDAIIDELINNNKCIYQYEINKNNYLYKINSIIDYDEYDDGNMSFKNQSKMTIDKIDVLIIPIQICYNNFGYIDSIEHIKLINNFKGIKIGVGFQFAKFHNLKFKWNVEFHKIILV